MKQAQTDSKKKRIAIIGSGISGQTCGYLLSQQHQVTLFEANGYLGGHTATCLTPATVSGFYRIGGCGPIT